MSRRRSCGEAIAGCTNVSLTSAAAGICTVHVSFLLYRNVVCMDDNKRPGYSETFPRNCLQLSDLYDKVEVFYDVKLTREEQQEGTTPPTRPVVGHVKKVQISTL